MKKNIRIGIIFGIVFGIIIFGFYSIPKLHPPQPNDTIITFYHGDEKIDPNTVNFTIYQILSAPGWNKSEWETIAFELNETHYSGFNIILDSDNFYSLTIEKSEYFQETFNLHQGNNYLPLNKIPDVMRIRTQPKMINQSIEIGYIHFDYGFEQNESIYFEDYYKLRLWEWFDFAKSQKVIPTLKISDVLDYEFAVLNLTNQITYLIGGDLYIPIVDYFDNQFELNRNSLGNPEISLGWIWNSDISTFEAILKLEGGI